MKSTKILIAAAVATTAIFSGCQKEVFTGIDTSKACAKDLNYDSKNSSEKTAAFYWDAEDAIKAGATSFSVQLYQYEDARDIDMYNSSIGQTVQATASTYDAVIFSGLTKGAKYFARVRANYPRSIYSDWTYLLLDGEKAQIKVGSDQVIKYGEFESPAPLVLKATPKSISCSWNSVEGAETYTLEYKKSADASWTVIDGLTVFAYTFANLSPMTSYDVRVKAVGAGKTSAYCENTISTREEGDFPKNMKTADEFISWLSEGAAITGPTDEFTLENDIDLAGKYITPAAEFNGILDCKGHALKNLELNGSPLFETNAGTVKNLVIDASCKLSPILAGNFGFVVKNNNGTVSNVINKANVEYTGSITDLTNFGIIVGYNSGLVENCVNNGNAILALIWDGGSNSAFGGVVGLFDGEAGKVMVKGCENTGKIALSTASTPKNVYLGGVVGASTNNAKGAGTLNLKNYGVVSGCTNKGEVSHSWSVSNSGSYCNVGGVAGYIEGSIESCTNKGTVSLSSPDNPAASSTRPSLGGVCGCVSVSAKDCVNAGQVNAVGIYAAGTEGNRAAGATHQPCFGGVFGIVGDAYLATSKEGFVENCGNTGTVNFNVCQKSAGGTKGNGGGVIGYTTVDVIGCYNEGDAELNLHHKIAYCGGIVGLSYALNIKDCWNNGTVSMDCMAEKLGANTTNYFSYQDYLAGICGGSFVKATIQNCENREKGVITYKNGLTTAVLNYVGGILGTYDASQVMNDCKNKGTIVVDSPEALEVGALCGAFNGVMTNCSAEGSVTVKQAKGNSGKEPEVGGITGYANASFNGCVNKCNITVEAGGTAYVGGIAGGFGSASSQWSGCTIDCTITTTSATGSILGRFRSSGTNTIYYKDFTFGEGVKSLALCGNLNGNNVTEGTKPE